MKNNQTVFGIVALILAGSMIGCSMFGGANSIANSGSNTNSKSASSKDSTPAIEITSKSLAEEWLADPAATDARYKGKTLAITGELYLAQMIGDKVFVDLVGVMFGPKVKGAKISCGGAADTESLLLIKAREANERMLRDNPTAKMPPPPTITVKGVYSASTPPDRPEMGTMDITPCQVQPTTRQPSQ